MGELVRPEEFSHRLREVLAYKNRLLVMFGAEPLDYDALHKEYSEYAERLRPFVCDTEAYVQDMVAKGSRVLFEGAQGTFLDLDSGTYPYVTSSHPVSGGACLGTGIGPRAIDNVLGVAKAYTTRVGSGPFPTELLNETGDFIREQGKEYGTTTGRGRRCGWLDLVVLKHSARLNSLSGWVLTRLDVLSGLDELQVCTAYEVDGKTIEHMPQMTIDLAKAKPVYRTMPGWNENLRGCRSWDDLPKNARDYLDFVADFTGSEIAIVSIGPDRDETIVLKPKLIWG
jgi:adenylosuccinate synthase